MQYIVNEQLQTLVSRETTKFSIHLSQHAPSAQSRSMQNPVDGRIPSMRQRHGRHRVFTREKAREMRDGDFREKPSIVHSAGWKKISAPLPAPRVIYISPLFYLRSDESYMRPRLVNHYAAREEALSAPDTCSPSSSTRTCVKWFLCPAVSNAAAFYYRGMQAYIGVFETVHRSCGGKIKLMLWRARSWDLLSFNRWKMWGKKSKWVRRELK